MIDVLIAGAGPAGLTCARMLAAQGLGVLVLEKGSREGFAASWVNDTDVDSFARYGLTEPRGQDLAFPVTREARLHSTDDLSQSVKPEIRDYSIRMDSYQERLLAEAEKAGAEIRFECSAESVLGDGLRATGLSFAGPGGQIGEIRARAVVLACGAQAEILSRLPTYLDLDLEVADRDWVAAVQEQWTLKKKKARELVDRGQLVDGAMVAYCGVPGAGAFSTLLYQMDLKKGVIGILGGSKTRAGVKGPGSIVRDFRRRFDVAGKKLYGGGREIPLRYVADSLVADGLVLLGDAGRCVCPANGSGTVSGMVTAALCAEALGSVLRRGEAPTRARLWPVNRGFHTGMGAVFAGYYITSRATSSLSEEEVQALLKKGVVNIRDFYKVHENRPVSMGAREGLGRLARGLGALSPLLRVAGRGPAAAMMTRHYRSYPRSWDPKSFRAWQKKRDLILSLARV